MARDFYKHLAQGVGENYAIAHLVRKEIRTPTLMTPVMCTGL